MLFYHIVSDAGYFAVTYDANSNSGTFAFALETQGDRRFHESTVEECKNIEQATFEGAAALLEEIKNSGYTSSPPSGGLFFFAKFNNLEGEHLCI